MVARPDSIWNPPGVRMIAKEIQKPPYEDRAVAPNVLPTAISLININYLLQSMRVDRYIPHTSEKLDKTSITVSNGNDKARRSDAACLNVD